MPVLALETYVQNLLPCAALGFVLDLLLGDPHWLWHPVRLIGRAISLFDKLLLGEIDKEEHRSKRKERGRGLLLVFIVLLLTFLISSGVLFFAYSLHPILGFCLQTYLSYTLLATKSLRVESMQVYFALKNDGLSAARRAVSMIVGRDTDVLDETGVLKAAVETVAENTSDGIVAPLLFLILGGPVVGYLYKAVNTMDSMVGYTNEKYRHFGSAAARLDPVLTFLPARLSALRLIAAAALLRLDAKAAARIWRRDKRNHASPNSAQTEAVMAGALGVQLAGDAVYFGKVKKKPTIGDDVRAVHTDDLRLANKLMTVTSLLAAVLFFGIRFLVSYN